MNKFFDLKEFFVTCVKRIKMIVLLTVLIAAIWGSYNAVPLFIERVNYKAPAIGEIEVVETDRPFQFVANRTILISPVAKNKNGVSFDEAEYIVNMFSAFAKNKETLGVLTNKYSEEYLEDKTELKKKMVNYNYRVKLFLQEKVTVVDFYSDITVQKTSPNSVDVLIATGNAELSEKIVDEYVTLLIKQVKGNYGDFNTIISNGQVMPTLPQPADGLIPVSVLNSGSSEIISGVRPSLTSIAKSGIRGGVYGALLGFLLALVVILLQDILTNKLKAGNYLEELGLTILSTAYSKKGNKNPGLHKKLINKLEGYSKTHVAVDNTASMVAAKLTAQYPQAKSVLVTGSVDVSEKFYNDLSEKLGDSIEVTFSPNVSYLNNDLDNVTKAEIVILVEQIDRSTKKEIKKEICDLQMMNKEIFGAVLYK